MSASYEDVPDGIRSRNARERDGWPQPEEEGWRCVLCVCGWCKDPACRGGTWCQAAFCCPEEGQGQAPTEEPGIIAARWDPKRMMLLDASDEDVGGAP